MIQLKEFQEKAKNELVISISNGVNAIRNSGGYVNSLTFGFQSPTGSGKTIMIQEALRDLVKLDNVFITWLAPGELANQSLKRFKDNELEVLDFSKLSVSDRADILSGNVKIGLINNEKVNNENNLLNRDNEENLNLPNIYSELKNLNTTLIFIIDESHIGAEKNNTNINKYIEKYANIKLFVSATLKNTENLEERRLINIDIKDVIKAEMIKKMVKFNPDFIGQDLSNTEVTEEYLLKLSINKLKELEKLHNGITPLLIIQVPNGYYAKTEEADIFIKEIIEKGNGYIKREDIKTFLSEENDLDENTCKNNSNVKVVITKVAAATGWDCPRAQVLLTYRYSSSKTLIKQLIGRILRMPERKHYENELLNYAYIYTNSEGIQEAFNSNLNGKNSYFENCTNELTYYLKEDFKNLNIPYLISYSSENSQLKDFKNIHKYFDIQFNNLILEEQELLSNMYIGSIENYDKNEIDISKTRTKTSSIQAKEDFLIRLKHEFSFLGKNNIPQIGNRIFKKFNNESNNKIAANYDLITKNLWELIKNYTDFKEREELLINESFVSDYFNLPSEINFSSDYNKNQYNKYMYEKLSIKSRLNNLEKELAETLESNIDIKAWIKNGDNGSQEFYIYYYDIEKNKVRKFFPDFIALTQNGIIWIIEVKGDHLLSNSETSAKFKYFKKYITDCQKTNYKIEGYFWVKDNSNISKLEPLN